MKEHHYAAALKEVENAGYTAAGNAAFVPTEQIKTIRHALRSSHYGQNPAGVPATAYLITIIAWPYTLYLTLFVYGDKE